MTNEKQNDSKTAVCHEFALTLDKGSTLTNVTDGLTNDIQDQGSNRLVPNAPTPVKKWRIKFERVWEARHYDGLVWVPGRFSAHKAWRVGMLRLRIGGSGYDVP